MPLDLHQFSIHPSLVSVFRFGHYSFRQASFQHLKPGSRWFWRISRAFPLKQYVELAVGAALGFRRAEVRPRKEESAGPGPEEHGLDVPIPCLWAEHARHQDADNVGLYQWPRISWVGRHARCYRRTGPGSGYCS
jgi:hypothetical protein